MGTTRVLNVQHSALFYKKTTEKKQGQPFRRFSFATGWILSSILFFICSSPALAQVGWMEKIQNALDDVARGVGLVGRKAEDLIGPGPELDTNEAAQYRQVRAFNERYPVDPAASILISNEFGKINVNTWDERVVQVTAEIRVGAEQEETAQKVADAIAVSVKDTATLVDIRTLLPETRRESGMVSIEVNYAVTLPRGASLVTRNFFGDTVVRGVGGTLTLSAQYGGVEISEIKGAVTAQVQGEFPVKAYGLAQGGAFYLQGSQAEFGAVSGRLQVEAFRGGVLLHELRDEVQMQVTCESAPVRLILPAEGTPDLSLTALFGEIESAVPLTRTAQGKCVLGRSAQADTKQQIHLHTTFGDISIERKGQERPTSLGEEELNKPFNDVLTKTEALTGETPVAIDAAVGDVRIEGIDENMLKVTATRIVWVSTAENAPPALETLELQVGLEAERMVVRTLAPKDMDALDTSAYRVDLLVQCPRTVPIEVRAEKGLTSIAGVGGHVRVNQMAGTVRVEHAKGKLDLNNQNGEVKVSESSGPVVATTRFGDLTLSRIFGLIEASAEQGRVVIDAPMGQVRARNVGGDVRILAMEGVGGAYDVSVERGNISILLGPKSDANLDVRAENGAVHSAIPLTGELSRTIQAFRGQMNAGTHLVHLQTQGGDIVLD